MVLNSNSIMTINAIDSKMLNNNISLDSRKGYDRRPFLEALDLLKNSDKKYLVIDCDSRKSGYIKSRFNTVIKENNITGFKVREFSDYSNGIYTTIYIDDTSKEES